MNKDHITCMQDIIRAHEGYYFTPDTMRFFNSKTYDPIVSKGHLHYFITSEKGPVSSSQRLYTIRVYNAKTDDITSHSEFQEFKTLDAAIRAMNKLKENKNG